MLLSLLKAEFYCEPSGCSIARLYRDRIYLQKALPHDSIGTTRITISEDNTVAYGAMQVLEGTAEELEKHSGFGKGPKDMPSASVADDPG